METHKSEQDSSHKSNRKIAGGWLGIVFASTSKWSLRLNHTITEIRATEMRSENREGRKRKGRNATVRANRVQALVTAGLLIAVGAKAQETKPVPPTPIDVKKGDLGEKVWNPAWDLIVEKAIPQAMIHSCAS